MANQRKSIYEYDKNYYEKASGKFFTEGNAARKLNYNAAIEYDYEADAEEIYEPEVLPSRKPETRPVRRINPAPAKKIRRKSNLDFLGFVALIAAMVATLMVCVGFLQKQSDINQLNTDTKQLRADYTALKDANDALETKLQAAVDYDYIYAVAVGRLGMVYPGENQMVNYSVNDSAYVIQYGEIPDTYGENTLGSILP